MYTFRKRQEIPFWNLPVFFGGSSQFPTDIRTISGYCQGIEELLTCYGNNFTDNCIRKELTEPPTVMVVYDWRIHFTLLGEGMLCPNEKNGLSFEEVSCFATTIQYINLKYYQCDNENMLGDAYTIYSMEHIICQLLIVDKRCGRKMSKTLCALFQSRYMDLIYTSRLTESCDFYMNSKCNCFRSWTIL